MLDRRHRTNLVVCRNSDVVEVVDDPPGGGRGVVDHAFDKRLQIVLAGPFPLPTSSVLPLKRAYPV